MDHLPSAENDDTLFIRTCFTDLDRWESLWTAVVTPNADGFRAYVKLIDDTANGNLAISRIGTLMSEDQLVLVADEVTLTTADRQVLALYRDEDGVQQLRVAVEALWDIQNNLSISNADWQDYADDANEDGVYRGT